jgi:hypothetical protein
VIGLFGSTTRAIEVGDSDDVFLEVRSGLDEGERVALLDVAGATARAGPPAAGAQGMRSRLPSQGGAPQLAPR